MPWTHCEQQVDDSSPCPSCGTSKAQWTVEFNVTRELRIARRGSALRLSLVDPSGNGVAGEPYRVTLADGQAIEGELNEEGAASVVDARSGECAIAFPRRARGAVAPYVDPDDDAAPAEPGAAPADEGAGCPTFRRPGGRRHRFQLARLLQLTLLDEEGERPLRFVDYALEGEGGARLEGTTDGAGRLDHGAAPLARYTLTVGDARCVVPAVLPEDAFLAVRVRGARPREEEFHEHDPHEGELANARWSATRARFDEEVLLIVDAPGADGEEVELEVLEHDADGEHDLVAILGAPVIDGVARVGWHMTAVTDTDDEPTEVDREAGFDLPEFIFVARLGESEARCEERLLFSTDLELPIVDARGERVREAEYVLRCGDQVRRGRTDAEGVLRERGVGPNFEVTLDGAVVRVTAREGRA